ncbi:MAG: ABC transporter ATP-binding protein [bacterium]|nr:ABC transporter ATP-binding protein [Acidimicrobiia bacterium]MCY4651312.1 ABC transporter ATP-binding protein [bacterium]
MSNTAAADPGTEAAAPRRAVEVEDLCVSFPSPERGKVTVVNEVSFSLDRGRTLAIVGESGAGKSMLSLALLGLTPKPGWVTASRVVVDGIDVTTLNDKGWSKVRGKNISMVFQDALSGLNPVRSVGAVLMEVIRRHQGVSKAQARQAATEMLESVGIPDAKTRLTVYPHQLSGGLRQRVMIALALVNRPAVLIADEPTTALDATIQAQILELLAEMITDAALLLVTHDLGVATSISDQIAVMYAGRFVEFGPTEEVLRRPRHPYSAGLLSAVPRFERERRPLVAIPGSPPSPSEVGQGCPFAPRCTRVQDRCITDRPPLEDLEGHPVACWNPVPA